MNKINFIAYSIVCVCKELSLLFKHSSDINETDVCNSLKELKDIVHLKGYYVYSSYKDKASFDIDLYFYNYDECITLNFKKKSVYPNNVERYIPSIKNRVIFVSEQMPLRVEGIIYCSRKLNVLIVCDDLYGFPYIKKRRKISLDAINNLESYSGGTSCLLCSKRQQIIDFVESNRNSINNLFIQDVCIDGSYLGNNIDVNFILDDLNIKDIDAIVGVSDEICGFVNQKLGGYMNCLSLSNQIPLIDKAGWIKKVIHKLYIEYIYSNDRRGLKESTRGFIKDYSLPVNYFSRLCFDALEKDECKFILDSLN